MHKLQIFVCQSQGVFRVGLLRNPRHIEDLLFGNGQAAILTVPLTSSKAYEALTFWEDRFRGRMRFLWWYVVCRKNARHQGQSTLSLAKAFDPAILDRLMEMLEGRLLSEQRIVGALRQEGFWPNEIGRALDFGVYTAKLRQFPGFKTGSWGSKICTRCQSEDAKSVPCLVCGSQDCLLCLGCQSMGEHRSCTILLTLAQSALNHGVRKPSRGPVELELTYQLTASQQQASQDLLEFWEQGDGKALVWAACGAGKTEVTFALIRRVLSDGGEVLFAIPRQDIVREMTERLQLAFPDVTVASHYGGKPWFAPGKLVVATTHQVLHFYKRFDLTILDEVDAFPYQGNEMLRMGLRRALLPQGKLVEMTATPYSQQGYEKVITIPARYHGFSLPEPELLIQPLPPWTAIQSADFPPCLLETLQGRNHPWLVFAPTIAACSKLQEVLSDVLDKPVGLCHSKVEDRNKTVQRLKHGELDIIVTTSVLERGVNFPGVGVIVLYADHAVFTASALIQIAGRVGRTTESPTGIVLFVGTRIARPMKKALTLIRDLNDQARERGLLYSETTS